MKLSSRLFFFYTLMAFAFFGRHVIAAGYDGAEIVYVRTVSIHGVAKRTIETWVDTIKNKYDIEDDNKAKGVLGEIVAIALFKTIGYDILENHSKRFIGCELTSKVGSAGIDGVFIRSAFPTIFNEAKYRKNGCRAGDLPVVSYGKEMSPRWVSYHFSHLRDSDMVKSPSCAGFDFEGIVKNYKSGRVSRTLTCLKEEGTIDLYHINDINRKINAQSVYIIKQINDLTRDNIESLI